LERPAKKIEHASPNPRVSPILLWELPALFIAPAGRVHLEVRVLCGPPAPIRQRHAKAIFTVAASISLEGWLRYEATWICPEKFPGRSKNMGQPEKNLIPPYFHPFSYLIEVLHFLYCSQQDLKPGLT